MIFPEVLGPKGEISLKYPTACLCLYIAAFNRYSRRHALLRQTAICVVSKRPWTIGGIQRVQGV